MKKFYILTLLFCFSMFSLYAGDEVNNGGGIAEQNIYFAYLNMEKYIDVCLHSSFCNINQEQRQLLTAIRNSLDQEYSNKEQIIFRREQDEPGFFLIDGDMKVAKTGDEIGSPIYINVDLLYFKNTSGMTEAISIDRAVAILIHEFCHHHGVHDYTKMDLIAANVSMLLQRFMISVPLFTHSSQVMAFVFNEKKKDRFPQILLYLFDEVVDVSKEFKEALKCNLITIPSPSDNLLDLSVPLKKPSGATFHNLYWLKSNFYKKKAILTIKGNLSSFCYSHDTLLTANKDYKALIKIKLRKVLEGENAGKWKFVPDSLKIKQKWEPWWKMIQLPF